MPSLILEEGTLLFLSSKAVSSTDLLEKIMQDRSCHRTCGNVLKNSSSFPSFIRMKYIFLLTLFQTKGGGEDKEENTSLFPKAILIKCWCYNINMLYCVITVKHENSCSWIFPYHFWSKGITVKKSFGFNLMSYSKWNAHAPSIPFYTITYSFHKNSEIKHMHMHVFVSKTEGVLTML